MTMRPNKASKLTSLGREQIPGFAQAGIASPRALSWRAYLPAAIRNMPDGSPAWHLEGGARKLEWCPLRRRRGRCGRRSHGSRSGGGHWYRRGRWLRRRSGWHRGWRGRRLRGRHCRGRRRWRGCRLRGRHCRGRRGGFRHRGCCHSGRFRRRCLRGFGTGTNANQTNGGEKCFHNCVFLNVGMTRKTEAFNAG